MKRFVRLAVTQYEMRTISTFDDFADQCNFYVKTASGYAADFVVFPELFSTQLLSTFRNLTPDDATEAVIRLSGHIQQLFSDFARRYKINIVAGSHLNRTALGLMNTAYFFDRAGNLTTQDKIHITPNERRVWDVKGGNEIRVIETDAGRIAICICYDIEFPELARITASEGAEIIFVPFNTDQLPGFVRVKYCAHARCIENHVYVAMSGCSGNLLYSKNACTHYAESGILTPADIYFADDARAGTCTAGSEGLLVRDVDLSLLERNREFGAVQNLKDRRLDLYEVKWKGAARAAEHAFLPGSSVVK